MRRPRRAATHLVLSLALAAPLGAQAIGRDDYLRYLPLGEYQIIGQSAATDALHLFGDRAAPGYRDEAPRNGIDDGRDRLLAALARRFAPIMVRNTTSGPMFHEQFIANNPSWPLYVDTWEAGGPVPALRRSEAIDFRRLRDEPCTPARPDGADCRLLALLRGQGPPGIRIAAPAGAAVPGALEKTVLFFDMPGDDPESWRQAYIDPSTGRLRRDFAGFSGIYVHPFIAALDGAEGRLGYELVLQYWTYYPLNDGGNNHEGDWEHVNVVYAPRSTLGRPLTEAEVAAVLARDPGALDGDDPLLLARVEHYFHHNVALLDYATPNSYQPRAAWERQARAIVGREAGLHRWYALIRDRAWRDAAETEVNTHPIVFIGGDSKGPDLLFNAPGGHNRDSHGAYPFTGLYKGVGPGGASEEVRRVFDLHRYAGADSAAWPEWAERYDDSARLEIVPDWERLLPMLGSEPEVRRRWAWLVLPIQWGFPATRSPLAGIIEHAETGNVSPIGPAFNSAWNIVGGNVNYLPYRPHLRSRAIPTNPLDAFANNLGFLNVPKALLANVPPVDLVFKLGFAPPRVLLDRRHPVFESGQRFPERRLALGVGLTHESRSPAYWAASINQAQALPIALAIFTANGTADIADSMADVAAVDDVEFSLDFQLGKRLAVSHTLRHTRGGFVVPTRKEDLSPGVALDGTLEMWDYGGAFRYRLLTGAIAPYLQLGYGWSWWRTTDVHVGGEPIDVPDGEWIRRPNPLKGRYLLPNQFKLGGGVEWRFIRSRHSFPDGIDVGLRVDYTASSQSLRLDEQVPTGIDIRVIDASGWRRALTAALQVWF